MTFGYFSMGRRGGRTAEFTSAQMRCSLGSRIASIVTAVVVVALGSVAFSGVATAESVYAFEGPGATNTHWRTSDGGAAKCTVAEGLTTIECEISDTAKDGNSVFVELARGLRYKERMVNEIGSDTTIQTFVRLESGHEFEDLRWKVCTNKTARRDSCSESVVFDAPPSFFELNCIGRDFNDWPTECDQPAGPGMSANCARAIVSQALGIKLNKMENPFEYVAGTAKVGAKVTVKWVPVLGWGLFVNGLYDAVDDCRV